MYLSLNTVEDSYFRLQPLDQLVGLLVELGCCFGGDSVAHESFGNESFGNQNKGTSH